MKKTKWLLVACGLCLALSSCYSLYPIYGYTGPIVIKDFGGATLDSIPDAHEIELSDNVLKYKEKKDDALPTYKIVQNCQVYSDNLDTEIVRFEKEPSILGTILLTFGVATGSLLLILLLGGL